MLVGSSVEDAVNRFVFEGETVLDIDPKPWPSN